MPGKIIMVTGGARSGKSEFAERYVLHYSPNAITLLRQKS